MKLFISFMAGLAVAGGAAFAQGVSPSHVFASLKFNFAFDKATTENAFVPRLWASRQMATRSGYGSVNQSFNNNAQISQGCVNSRNGYWDANMNRVSISTFQQVNDRAFFRRGNRWVDSSLVDKAEAAPKNVVEVGSPEFRRLAERLAAQSRQGCVALNGEILLNVDGETILVR